MAASQRPRVSSFDVHDIEVVGRHVDALPAFATRRYRRRMRSVGIDALNSRLREYVRLAASGESILVTDRDRVVAELGPPQETRSPVLADPLLARLVRGGVLTPPVLPASGRPPKPPPIARLDDLLAELGEARGDRFPGRGRAT